MAIPPIAGLKNKPIGFVSSHRILAPSHEASDMRKRFPTRLASAANSRSWAVFPNEVINQPLCGHRVTKRCLGKMGCLGRN